MMSLEGPHSIVGRSVVVHAKADDFKTLSRPATRVRALPAESSVSQNKHCSPFRPRAPAGAEGS